jgi:hypothetical protein
VNGTRALAGLALLPQAERIRQLAIRMDAARAHRLASDTDDIADPIGCHASIHAEVAKVIEAALRPLADVLLSTRSPVPTSVAS